MKATLNLADRHNRAHHLAATIARWLLPLLGCWLLILLISQGMALHQQQSLAGELNNLATRARTENPQVPKAVSDEELKRQETNILFIEQLTAKDQFSWTELLGRLEKAMTLGITLTGIEPDYREGNLQIAGLAEDVEALRGYLASLLHSDSLAGAFLQQHETREIKDRQGRQHSVVAFRIEIQKAF